MAKVKADLGAQTTKTWLRDPIWEYRGVCVGIISFIVSLGVTFLIYSWQRQVKSLSYGIVSSAPLVSVQDDVASRVNVTFDGSPVPDVRLAVVRVVNSGNVPIEKQDFERPVSFTFGKETKGKILDAIVAQTTPPGMGAAIIQNGNTVAIKPALLNPNDSITLRVLLTGGDWQIEADARVVGVPEIVKADFSQQQKRTGNLRWLAAIPVIVGLIGFFVSSLAGWILDGERRKMEEDRRQMEEEKRKIEDRLEQLKHPSDT